MGVKVCQARDPHGKRYGAQEAGLGEVRVEAVGWGWVGGNHSPGPL